MVRGLCVVVESVSREHCDIYDEMNITSLHGFIANSITSDIPECIGASHPWVIIAQPGQRVNLTLYDFAVEDKSIGIYNVVEQPNVKKCHDYGIIKEYTNSESPICGGQKRVSHLYTSEAHVVKVWVTNDQHAKDIKRFVIEYSGKSTLND